MYNSLKSVRYFAILVCCLTLVTCGQSKQKTDSGSAATQNVSPKDSLMVEFTGADSVSVFDLLRQSHDVDYQPSAMGVFVKAIDSVYSNDRYFWVYSVNDTMAKVAADNYLTSDSDRVVWHFRRIGQ